MSEQKTEKLYGSFHRKVLQSVDFVIDGAGENGAARTFKLVLDFNAIAKIEDVLHRDLKNFEQWKTKSDKNPNGLTSSDITFVCWAAFDRFHPEVTLREVRQWLAPTDIDILWLVLLEMCFPGIVAASEEARKLKESSGGALGEPKPTPAS